MAQEIKVGLVGFGLGGQAFHAPYVTATPGMTLSAVVSSDSAKVHRRYPDVIVVPTIEALLGLPDIDLVVVSSPDAFHAEHALAAICKGRHVVVDKPFAATLAEAERVGRAADQAGTMLTIFHNRRWDADFLTLRRIMGEGLLGDIVQFESHFDRWRPTASTLWKDARAGGVWFDLGPHLVDQALCLFGMPEAVYVDIAAFRPDAPAPDYFHAILHYPGRRAILHAGKQVADHRLRFAVHGTAGSWIKQGVDPQEAAALAGGAPNSAGWGSDPLSGTFTAAGQPDIARNIANERGDYGRFWKDVAAAIRGEGRNPVPHGEAINVMRILDAGLTSAKTGRRVTLEH
ncbi:oxidoreductase [Sphingobium sp.]|uniref:oxidoreductase n=1 Tax=Sphingobium sp. TaxID=1912891 RepID=UPI0035C6E586